MTAQVSQYQNISILDFTAAKDDGGGDDNWRYRTYKSPVKSSPSINQHPVLQAGCPSCRPAVSKHFRFVHPKLTWGLPTLTLSTTGSR